jgi:hypothetical protein
MLPDNLTALLVCPFLSPVLVGVAEPFELNRSWLDRLVMRRPAPSPTAPPPGRVQAHKNRSRLEPRYWIFVV